MDIDQTKIAIGAILALVVSMGVLGYLSGDAPDIGIVSAGIAAIAGLAGFEMKKE